jgi:pimeloyl-ACP methyl ester carboxylesterase
MSVVTRFSRGDLTFDVTEDGPSDGEPVVLLHGFPQRSNCWNAVVPPLASAGYHVIRMDQRGYSPGARPSGRRAYRSTEVVADAAALVDHYGGSAHVVGHDWGAAVAWALAAERPEAVRSLTAVSVPHPEAFTRALVTSSQAVRSWYMLFFQLPWLPERILRSQFERIMRMSGQSAEAARRDAAGFDEPGALTGALNWYRAIPLVDPRRQNALVQAPTLFVWSDGDIAITRRGVDNTPRYVRGPYQFVVLHGVSHWIPDEVPDRLADLLLDHLNRWS